MSCFVLLLCPLLFKTSFKTRQCNFWRNYCVITGFWEERTLNYVPEGWRFIAGKDISVINFVLLCVSAHIWLCVIVTTLPVLVHMYWCTCMHMHLFVLMRTDSSNQLISHAHLYFNCSSGHKYLWLVKEDWICGCKKCPHFLLSIFVQVYNTIGFAPSAFFSLCHTGHISWNSPFFPYVLWKHVCIDFSFYHEAEKIMMIIIILK